MRLLVGSIILISCISLAGCYYTTVPEEMGGSKLTAGEVKRQIVKNETTQAEILEYFGSPNLTSINRDGEEVWSYNKMRYETMRGSEGFSLILIGGSKAVSAATTKSFDLIITFDSKDVVKDYKVIQASY